MDATTAYNFPKSLIKKHNNSDSKINNFATHGKQPTFFQQNHNNVFAHKALYFADSEAYTLGINQQYEEITGLSQSDVIGKNLKELEKVFFKPSVTLKVLKAKVPITIPQKLLKNNKDLLVTGNPVYDQEGRISMVITVVEPLDEFARYYSKQALSQRSFRTVGNMVLESAEMQEIMKKVALIASTDSNVLITGESGAGKELVARAVHDLSSRKNAPFVAINMASISSNLIESELFGYVGGAYTGASPKGGLGFAKAASGGTLFLDEIADVPINIQLKLLRLLEQKEIVPVGSSRVEKVDIRVICATNQELSEMLRQKKLRHDLYYRLNDFHILVPPLRERKGDIIALSNYFLDEFNHRFNTQKHFSPESLEALQGYPWPGNVRELKSVLKRVVVLYPFTKIKREHIENELDTMNSQQNCSIDFFLENNQLQELNLNDAVAYFEKEFIKTHMEKHGNIESCAGALGVHRTTLIRKMKRYGIKY